MVKFIFIYTLLRDAYYKRVYFDMLHFSLAYFLIVITVSFFAVRNVASPQKKICIC